MTWESFRKLYAGLVFGTTAIYALVLFVPLWTTVSPWNSNTMDRFSKSLPLVLAPLLALVCSKFPWRKSATGDVPWTDTTGFALLMMASSIWVVFQPLILLLLVMTSARWN